MTHSENLIARHIHSRDLKLIALVKGKERYVFCFNDDQRHNLLRTFARFATNPDLSFTWNDAGVLSQKAKAM
jgi:hypothetical protein